METEIAHPEARLFPKGPLSDPRSGYRYVFDDAMTHPRIYDPSGTMLTVDAAAVPAASAAAGKHGDGLVFADVDLPTRRGQLVRQFGPPVGSVGARQRFLAHDGDLTTETLVESSTLLPVEVNVLRRGALEHRTLLAYGRLPGGRWYVATAQSETTVPGAPGRRFVSRRTHTNVVAAEAR